MLLFLSSLVHAEPLPAGSEIERAVAIHLSQNGLRRLGDGVESLVPAEIPISNLGGDFECDAGSGDLLTYTLDNTELLLTAQNVDIHTENGLLDITLYLTLASTPAQLTVQGNCSFLTDLDDVCDLEIPTTLLVVNMQMALELVDGPDGLPVVDATVSDPTFELSPIGNPLDNCTLSNAIGTLLNTDEELLSKLVVGLIEPELAGIGADLETTVEDALDALVIDTSLSLGSGSLELALYPTLLELGDQGLIIGLGGTSVPSQLSDCVVDPGGSEFANSPWPNFDDTAWESSLEYDAGLFLSKDFLDHVLYGVYASGGLCLEVADLGGAELSTDLFGSIFGESFQALYRDDAQSMAIATRPSQAPTIRFEADGAPLRLDLVDFGLDVYSRLDDRGLRLTRVDLAAEVGIDPGLTNTALAPELIIDTEKIFFVESINEFMEPGYSDGLVDFVPTVLGTFLPEDLLPTIAIPELYGIGLDTVFWEPSATGDWQGGFVLLDLENVEPISAPGCDGGSLGCDGGQGIDIEAALGCDGGLGCESEGAGCEDSSCSTSPNGPLRTSRRFLVPNRLVLLGMLGMACLMRRRRD